MIDFSFIQRARALVEASRLLIRKITEEPPSKKASKKRPLGARRTRFTTLASSLAALGIVGPRFFFLFFSLRFFFLFLLLLFFYFLGIGLRCAGAFSKIRAAANSRNRTITSYTLIYSPKIHAYRVNKSWMNLRKIDTKKRHEDHVTNEKRYCQDANYTLGIFLFIS